MMGCAETTIQSWPSIRVAVNSVVVIFITHTQHPYSIDEIVVSVDVSNVALPSNPQLIFILLESVVIRFDNIFPLLYSFQVILCEHERERIHGG